MKKRQGTAEKIYLGFSLTFQKRLVSKIRSVGIHPGTTNEIESWPASRRQLKINGNISSRGNYQLE